MSSELTAKEVLDALEADIAAMKAAFGQYCTSDAALLLQALHVSIAVQRRRIADHERVAA